MNIVLIGYRCCGKTTVGKILARELGRDFLDTDLLIEKRVGCSIKSMVSSKGWDHFREVENALVREVAGKDGLVIATGGGVVMDRENVKELKRNGSIVWLNGTAEALRKRMDMDERVGKMRPSLTGRTPLEEIDQILTMRAPFYEEAHDLQVDTTCLSVQEVIEAIIKGLEEDKKGGIA